MRNAAVALFLILAGPALATVDNWPALYDVAFVEADDALNVRSGPSTDAPIIGTLAHDATSIEITAVDDSFEWGRVNIGEQSGWASMRFLDRHPGQFENFPPPFRQCFGTEPFWTLRSDGKDLSFSWQEDEGWTVPLATVAGSRNYLYRHAFLGEGVTLVMAPEECSDGMSDRHYGLAADLIITRGGSVEMFTGCCTLAGG